MIRVCWVLELLGLVFTGLGHAFFFFIWGIWGRVQKCSHRVMSHAQEIALEKLLFKNYFQLIELSYKGL